MHAGLSQPGEEAVEKCVTWHSFSCTSSWRGWEGSLMILILCGHGVSEMCPVGMGGAMSTHINALQGPLVGISAT